MTIFITGASKGIGKAMALHLAARGHNMVINGSRDFDALNEVHQNILQLGAKSLPLFGDVSDYDTTYGFFEKISDKFGCIDVLINNAGISHIGFFADMQENQWRRLINVNLFGVINCCHAAVPYMLNAGNGRIINISSIWGNVGASCEAVYSMTKGGVNAFTKSLAKELGMSGICVNAIACGLIDTEMNSALDNNDLEDFINRLALKRQGRPEEVACLAEFIINADYVTGEIFTLDGGY